MTTYTPEANHIFSMFFRTQLSSVIKDDRPKGELPEYEYTLEMAKARYKEITNQDMPIFFPDHITETSFKLDNYSAGGQPYINSNKLELTYKLSRKFNNHAFKQKYEGVTDAYLSNNTITVPLNYRIPKSGLNFDPKKQNLRTKNKEKLDKLLNISNNKALFPRILKIMTFILARERGIVPGPESSRELMQREYGLICWSIVNATLKGKFKCGQNMIKLLQSAHSNATGDVDKNNDSADIDILEESKIMKEKYTNGTKGRKNHHLQLYVMAFWDGYINEELKDVTNWDHVSSSTNFDFKEFHLPYSFKGKDDPDIGQVITVTIEKRDNNDRIIIEASQITITDSPEFKISNTSNKDTYSLDGNVLFTIQ